MWGDIQRSRTVQKGIQQVSISHVLLSFPYPTFDLFFSPSWEWKKKSICSAFLHKVNFILCTEVTSLFFSLLLSSRNCKGMTISGCVSFVAYRDLYHHLIYPTILIFTDQTYYCAYDFEAVVIIFRCNKTGLSICNFISSSTPFNRRK